MSVMFRKQFRGDSELAKRILLEIKDLFTSLDMIMVNIPDPDDQSVADFKLITLRVKQYAKDVVSIAKRNNSHIDEATELGDLLDNLFHTH